MSSSLDYMPWSCQKWVFNPDDPKMWRPKKIPLQTRMETDAKGDIIKSLKHDIEKRDVLIELLTQSKEAIEQNLTTLKKRDKVLQLVIEDRDAQVEELKQRVLELEEQVEQGKRDLAYIQEMYHDTQDLYFTLMERVHVEPHFQGLPVSRSDTGLAENLE